MTPATLIRTARLNQINDDFDLEYIFGKADNEKMIREHVLKLVNMLRWYCDDIETIAQVIIESAPLKAKTDITLSDVINISKTDYLW